MITKKFLLDHIDNLYEQVNDLHQRVKNLEYAQLKKDLKKCEKKATKKAPVKRGPGRPKKNAK